MKFNNLKVKTKIILLTSLLLCVTVLMATISIMNQAKSNKQDLMHLEERIRKDYDNNIKKQVENVVSLLGGIYAKYEAGEYTLEESKVVGADLIRELRYAERDIFGLIHMKEIMLYY